MYRSLTAGDDNTISGVIADTISCNGIIKINFADLRLNVTPCESHSLELVNCAQTKACRSGRNTTKQTAQESDKGTQN